MPYSYDQLVAAYDALGLTRGQVVYVTADLKKVMDFEERSGRAVLNAHEMAIRSCVGESGTVVVSTASLNLCNTAIPFDPTSTPSYQRGAFSEHIRRLPDARRSFHPFRSYAAVGARAGNIVDGTSRNAVGPASPEARMVDADALAVSIGLHPRFTCSAVHHVEQLVGVPYRYIKEFIHPVVRNGHIACEPFYMHVWYRDMTLERDHNCKLFARLNGRLTIREASVGAGRLYAYSVREFVAEASTIFVDDIYVWCARPPERRPYQA